MVRLPIPTTNNCNSNFGSKKQQCLHLLSLCSTFKHLSQIHAQIQVSGFRKDHFLLTQLVRFCALSPAKNFAYARTLLRHSESSPPSSWNFLIRGYASSDSPREAIWVFRVMLHSGVRPHLLTFPFLIKCCASAAALKEGKQVHVGVVKCGLDCDVYVQNNLVHFYGECKKIKDARKVFDEMFERSVVSWNAVITACIENFWFNEGIEYFVKMRDCGFEPDETRMVVVLNASSELGNLSIGRWVHSQVIVRGLALNCQLGTALVDMYAKSGALGYARIVFDKMETRNVWTWSAMIVGLAQHGFAKEALELFPKMLSSPINPNYVTFLGVLCACSHAGLVEDGYRFFNDMEHVHGITPMMVHYGAMVDILGRAGRLNEAYSFMMSMPLDPDPVIWRTLLSACTTHSAKDNKGVGNKVREKLLELEPKRGGNLVMAANMFAEVGMWDKAANLRMVMKERQMKKMAGESCVELGGSIHKFFSGFDSQADYEDVYQILDVLSLHMKLVNM
ncbi:hypothetical protein TB2_023234 [Malus domestica]